MTTVNTRGSEFKVRQTVKNVVTTVGSDWSVLRTPQTVPSLLTRFIGLVVYRSHLDSRP
jgi:hypothetical protein